MPKNYIRIFSISIIVGIIVGFTLALLKSSSVLIVLGSGIAVGVSIARINSKERLEPPVKKPPETSTM